MTENVLGVAAPRRPRRAVLSLGSNLGERLDQLQAAVDALADAPGVRVVAVSPVYETEPVGGPGQPEYLNAVVVVETTLPPRLLLEHGQAIEEALRRVRTDLVTYEDETSDDPELTLPHPRAHERAFVLAPWYDVDPAAVLPGHGPVARLLDAVRGQGVRRTDLQLRMPE
ncbi:2-amino-4-hydroxy-6-hydroxymethyldihydropteridine diphosphokinase [Carbonactinospora thermoautotrophica]|uniref:2-amino-4-hydroxy-6- hydroxymethyldihydropteridine diphosphokinase n=1 Tax=Carbonactinospora thermoautotrophica TaxID=1469144 RepID=UPI003DA9B106